MDISSHKGPGVKKPIEGRGGELMYLPPYSPELNPIGEAFAKVKGILRKEQARSREALVAAMGAALFSVSSRDARSFFEWTNRYD